MRIITYAAITAVAAAVVSEAYLVGRSQGADTLRAAYTEAALVSAETDRVSDLARQLLQQERDALARRLEDAARDEPSTAPNCLPPSRVRRLNQIRPDAQNPALPAPGPAAP